MITLQHDVCFNKCDENDPVNCAFLWYKSQNFPRPETTAGWESLCEIICSKIRELCQKTTNAALTTVPVTTLSENGKYLDDLRNGNLSAPSLNNAVVSCEKDVWDEVKTGLPQNEQFTPAVEIKAPQQPVFPKPVAPYHVAAAAVDDDDPWASDYLKPVAVEVPKPLSSATTQKSSATVESQKPSAVIPDSQKPSLFVRQVQNAPVIVTEAQKPTPEFQKPSAFVAPAVLPEVQKPFAPVIEAPKPVESVAEVPKPQAYPPRRRFTKLVE